MVKYMSHKIHHFKHLKAYRSVALSTHTVLCNHNHNHDLVPEYFHHFKGNPIPFAVTPHSPSQSLATSSLLFVSMDLPVLGISDGWNHMVCGLRCLIYFTHHHVLKVHSRGSTYQNFIPLYGRRTSIVLPYHVSSSTCQPVDIWVVSIFGLSWMLLLWTTSRKLCLHTSFTCLWTLSWPHDLYCFSIWLYTTGRLSYLIEE